MQLYDYQEQLSDQAAVILKEHMLVYLCMQVRTGKTLTAFTAAEKFGAKSYLFITKKKAIGSIEGDAEDIKTSMTGIVTNYEQLANITDTSYDIVIIDEAHSIGQYPVPAKRTQLLKELCANKPIIYLSGTPSPESFSQLYHQFYISSFSPFSEYKNFYKWAADYVTLKKKYIYNRQINDYSSAHKEQIEAASRHLFITYTQEEAGFQSLVEEEVIYLRMTPATYYVATKLIRDRIYNTKDGRVILADTEVKLQNKIQQVYSGTVICEDKTGIIFDRSKATFIQEHFSGKKIAIFYLFKAELVLLQSVFGSKNITNSPEDFRDSSTLIYASQIQSGSMGVNLASADYLIMLNVHHSNVLYWQARARLQTKDRTMPAKVVWIFAENGIEHKIYEAVQNKRDYVLKYFKKDREILSLGTKKEKVLEEQVAGFMADHGINEISIGSRSMKLSTSSENLGLGGKNLQQESLFKS